MGKDSSHVATFGSPGKPSSKVLGNKVKPFAVSGGPASVAKGPRTGFTPEVVEVRCATSKKC